MRLSKSTLKALLVSLGVMTLGSYQAGASVVGISGDVSGHTIAKKAFSGDFNGDGFLDTALCDSYLYPVSADASCVVANVGDPYDPTDDIAASDAYDTNCDGSTSQGGVYIFTSPLATVSAASPVGSTMSNASIVLEGRGYHQYSGYNCDVLDANGDGIDDLLVSARQVNSDYAYLVLGSATLSSGKLTDHINITNSSGYSGYVDVGAVDINSDGFDEMLVSAPSTNTTMSTKAIKGASTLGADIDLTTYTDAIESQISVVANGTSSTATNEYLTGIGDFNGDGYGDYLVGAYNQDRLYLVLGNANPTAALLSSPIKYTLAGAYQIKTSQAISGAGDVNGDGYDDFLVAYSDSTQGGVSYAGGVYLVLGRASPADDTLANVGTLYYGTMASEYAGYSVAGMGDVNADGYDDFMIGAPGYKNRALNTAGAAFLVLGAPVLNSAALRPTSAIRLYLGKSAGDQLGYYVAKGGVANGKTRFYIYAPYNDDYAADVGKFYLVDSLPGSATSWQIVLP